MIKRDSRGRITIPLSEVEFLDSLKPDYCERFLPGMFSVINGRELGDRRRLGTAVVLPTCIDYADSGSADVFVILLSWACASLYGPPVRLSPPPRR